MYLVEKCWANGKWWEIHWLHIRKKQVISCTLKRCTWSCLAMDGMAILWCFRNSKASEFREVWDGTGSTMPSPLEFLRQTCCLSGSSDCPWWCWRNLSMMRKRMLVMWNIYENSSHHVTLGSKKASQVRIPANYWSFKCDGNRSRVQVTRLVNYRMTNLFVSISCQYALQHYFFPELQHVIHGQFYAQHI